jgi:hypothetical protein
VILIRTFENFNDGDVRKFDWKIISNLTTVFHWRMTDMRCMWHQSIHEIAGKRFYESLDTDHGREGLKLQSYVVANR